MGYHLPRSSSGNGGSRKNCLGIPKSFSLSCSKRILTSASIRYWGLPPPPTADPPTGWALSWLTTRGTLSLISCVLPFLRRRISCYKSFNISAIQVTGSDSCLARLCSDTTSCSTRGTLFLCLKLLHFLPRAQRPQVARWYFCCSLVLEPCSVKGLLLPFPLPSPQRSRQNVRVFFWTVPKPKLKRGPWTFVL